MTRAKRMKPVQHLLEDTERRLALGLAAIERKVADAETKLQELERYRADYDKQFAQRAGGGIGVTALRDYQAFLARLSEAIKQQQAVVKRAQSERDAERQRWQEAAKRSKALDHVVEQWQTEERRASDRREQRESDERAQRRVPKT
ncbi:MAG TPA: flagellar export protein FliJ [Steroidobacteraceae bacterium]